MLKRFKFITIIASLMLCVAFIGFGVYAATQTTFTISSKVSFTPSDANLQILGYIDGISQDEEDNKGVVKSYYGANYNTLGEVSQADGNYTRNGDADTFNEWQWGNIVLDAGTKGQVTNENHGIMAYGMVIYLQVSNFTSRAIQYTVGLTTGSADRLSASHLSCTAEYYVAQNANAGVTNGTNGFYQLAPQTPWSKTNKPSAIPNGTHVKNGDVTLGTPISASTDDATIMIKITISPTNEFDKTNDLSAIVFGFNFSASYAE